MFSGGSETVHLETIRLIKNLYGFFEFVESSFSITMPQFDEQSHRKTVFVYPIGCNYKYD